MNCPYCNNPVPANSPQCPACGAQIPAQTSQFPQAAPQPAPAAAQSVVVQVGNIGGAPVAPATPPKSRSAYVLLAFFFGGLGIHNFYAGRTGMAIAQLLITLLSAGFLAGISGLIALFEIFTVKVDGKGVPMKPSALPAILGALMLIIIIGVPALFVANSVLWGESAQKAKRAECCNNLKQIGTCLMIYVEDHKGVLPASLDELKSGYYLSASNCICPSEKREYIYVGGNLNLYHLGIGCPIAFDRPAAHKGKINVLFADGSVRQVQMPSYVYTPADVVKYLFDSGEAHAYGSMASQIKEALIKNAKKCY